MQGNKMMIILSKFKGPRLIVPSAEVLPTPFVQILAGKFEQKFLKFFCA